MKTLIWGAGAIGGTIAAHLARAGHDVVAVDREAAHVEAINARGLHITGPIATFTAQLPAFTPEEVEGTFQRVFLCVKAHHTEGAMQQLLPHLAEDGYVVSAQNGLNELVIAEMAGAARTIGCFVNFGADYLEPGVIHYGGRGAVVVGELDGRITERLRELHRALLDFDDAAIMTDNIWGYLWGKLAYGAQLFATALTNESIADALAMPEYRPLFTALAREVLAVAVARGIRPEGFNGFDPAAFMPGASDEEAERSLDEMVAFNRRSAKTHSGVWRDLAVRKRRTEVDAQLGPIVRLGREVGLETPLTARLIELIHDIEEGRRPQALANLDELRQFLPG
ncbi:MAG: 2-dehydropantoate 2-reductase [Anaerolineae bacterium]